MDQKIKKLQTIKTKYQSILIKKLSEEGIKEIPLEDENVKLSLVKPTVVDWDMEKLRELLHKKHIIESKVIKEHVSYSVDEKVLDVLVRNRILKVRDLQQVSIIKPHKSFVRFFNLPPKE